MSDNEETGLSDHSSDRSSLAKTKKLFRRMYLSDSGDQSTVPPLMVQYLDSQKKVAQARQMMGDTSSTSDDTDRGTGTESLSDMTSFPRTDRDADFSSSDPPTCESGHTQSMSTPREFVQDPLVTNRLVLARNALEDIFEDDQINRDFQRKRRFLRMAFNLFHIDSMEEFCAAANISDEKILIKKYENLLVRIECACNKWEKQKHEARLALKEQRAKDFADTGVSFVDSDVSTPCLSYTSLASDGGEGKFDKKTPYPAKSMYLYHKRANYYDIEGKYDLASKSLSI